MPANSPQPRRSAGQRPKDRDRVSEGNIEASAEDKVGKLALLAWRLCDPVHLGTADR